MHTKTIWSIVLILGTWSINAQFHTLKLPQRSPAVLEEQVLGVTKISLDYSSPSARGREVWTNPRIIPQNGEPFAWRAGANMNTTISFDTEVYIEGQKLAAGKYGLHVISNGHDHQVLFAHANHLWGSYYLDTLKDVSLRVSVKDTSCTYSEKLDFEFDHLNDSTLILGLEWGDRRIPIEIKVDLVKTVMHSLRSELRGLNTYRWEAWDDAARFCYDHQQHLEEGLTWVERSISGGSGGFGANGNLYNYGTKLNLLGALGRLEDQKNWAEAARDLAGDRNARLTWASGLLQNGLYSEALIYLEALEKDLSDDWVVKLDLGVAQYHTGKKEEALKTLNDLSEVVPDFFKNRLKQVIGEMEAGDYQFPQALHLRS